MLRWRGAAKAAAVGSTGRLFSSGVAARKIEMYDTTLRDGTQGEGVSLSLHDKLQIAERLDDMGFDYIEGGYPLSNEKDVAFFECARALKLRHASVCAFGMTRRRGVGPEADPGMNALLQSEAPVCTIVGKTWDFHVKEVLRVSQEENVDMIYSSLHFLGSSHGRRIMYDAEHFFDGYKANPDYALKTIEAAAQAGAEVIILCDTNGGTTPAEISALTRKAVEAVAQHGARIGVHCHNDCELAVANSLAAVEAGASQVQGTINGVGERCGNADLVSVAANLGLKREGYDVLLGEESLQGLTELSRFVYETANLALRPGQPFVGKSAFAHKGGMHAHAMQLAPTSYEHIDPSSVGNERRILVSELSGRSNIAALTAGRKIDDPDVVKRVLAEVVRLESLGYQFEAAQASFDLLVQKCSGKFTAHFQRLKCALMPRCFRGVGASAARPLPPLCSRYNVDVESACKGEDQKVDAPQVAEELTEATVKIRLPDGSVRHEVAEGDGPVAALDGALRKALVEYYASVNDLHLVDYKVRVVNGMEAGTSASIRVIIESSDKATGDIFSTVGVSSNIIEVRARAFHGRNMRMCLSCDLSSRRAGAPWWMPSSTSCPGTTPERRRPHSTRGQKTLSSTPPSAPAARPVAAHNSRPRARCGLVPGSHALAEASASRTAWNRHKGRGRGWHWPTGNGWVKLAGATRRAHPSRQLIVALGGAWKPARYQPMWAKKSDACRPNS